MSVRSSTWKVIAALLVVVTLTGWGVGGSAYAKTAEIKHVILFIGDGMQLEHEIATSRYLYGSDSALSFQTLPYNSYLSTWDVTTYNRYARAAGAPLYDPAAIAPAVGYDPLQGGWKPFPAQTSHLDNANSYFLTPLDRAVPATDSASAATAWATGYKTDDGNLAWLPGDPANGSLNTIAELVRAERSWAMGVVSTVPFNHATPAAHVSHNKSRNNYGQIADEIIRTVQPEVVIGGGHPTYSPGYQVGPLYNAIKGGAVPSYIFVERQAGVDGGKAILAGAKAAIAQGKKLFGLFGGPGGNFEPPVPTDDGSAAVSRATIENPLLKDATVAALEVLSSDPDGFFVMIEQGDIDWANHANDYQWMVGTTWDLDQAVKAAIKFVNRPGDDVAWNNTLIIVTSDHGNSYMRLSETTQLGRGDLPTQVAGGPCSYNPAATCFNYPDGEVSYSTGGHTNELTSIYAIGAPDALRTVRAHEGKWYPCTRIIDNTQLFDIIAQVAGVSARSPLQANVAPGLCQ